VVIPTVADPGPVAAILHPADAARSRRMVGRASSMRLTALLLPNMVWIVLFLAGPLILLGEISLHAYVPGRGIIDGWQLGNYARVFTDTLFLRVIGNTLLLGGWTTLLCAILGFPLAIALVRASGVGRVLLYFAIVIPLLTSAVTKTFGWTILLSNGGVINQMLQAVGLTDRPVKLMYTMTGAVLALTQVLLPFMTLALAAALKNIDTAIYEAARNLGGRGPRIFLTVTLPLSLPGLVSGAVLVFTLAVSAYVTPRLVGGPTVKVVSVMIYEQSMTLLNLPLGAALSYLLLLIVLVLFVATLRLGRERAAS
jgi:putative spermidine/putrescine transport system permease protein